MKVALLLVAAATAGAAGCTSNDLSLSILQLEAITRSAQCVAVASAGTGTVGRDRGLLDVALVTTSGYIAVPVVRNNLTTLQTGGLERNSIQILGANIKLDDASGKGLTLPSGQQSFFYAAAAGRLDPGMSVPMFVEVLPPAAARSLAGMIGSSGVYTVIAEIRPVGMHSSDQVVGGPISFPIDLCNGCLTPTPMTCPLPKGSTPVDPCFPQQDEVQLCCTDATNKTFCGSAAPIATM